MVTTGWKMGNGWTIAGAGIGSTTVKLNQFITVTPHPVTGQGKRFVIASDVNDPFEKFVVRDMTIDANWPFLTGKPSDGKAAVMSVGIYCRGNATVENVLSLHTYGDRLSENECFSIFLSHPDYIGPIGFVSDSTLTIRNCSAAAGFGNYVVGMTAFSQRKADMRGNVCRDLPNGYPPGTYPSPNEGGAVPSSAYQFTGRGITLTDNQTFNCPVGLYFDTGNIYDALIANNQFRGCNWAGILTN